MIVLVHLSATASMVGGVEAPLVFFHFRRGKLKIRFRLARFAKFRPVQTEILSPDAPIKLNGLGAGRAN